MGSSKSESNSESNVEGLAALYSGVLQNFSTVHSADDAIENKTTALFAASIIVLILVLDRAQDWRALTITGVALLSAAILVSLFVIWSRGYGSAAVNVKRNQDYLDMKNEGLILQLISDIEESLGESTKILNKKAKAYRAVLILFALGSTFSILSFYIKVVGA